MSDDAEGFPLAPKSAELTQLVEFARSDLPSDEQWAALTAQLAGVWGAGAGGGGDQAGLEQPGLDQTSGPISHVSPTAAKTGAGGQAGAAGGVKAASQASIVLPGVAKVAGFAALAGALASGVWFASSPAAPVVPPTLMTTAPIASAPIASAPSVAAEVRVEAAAPELHDLETSAPEPKPLSVANGPSKVAAGASELSLLTRARDQLSKDPEQSLALCRQHQRMYPHGQLAQEREVLLIEALGRLNREKEAGRRRTQFGKTFPDSPHQSRIKQGSGN
jgi:hypothetical protein